MALQKQVIDLGLAVGVDQGTDSKLVKPGSNAKVSNGVFSRDGRIDKVDGHTSSDLTHDGGADSIEGAGCAFLHDGAMIVEGVFEDSSGRGNHPEFATYDPVDDLIERYDDAGIEHAAPCAWSEARRLGELEGSSTMCSTAQLNGLEVQAWIGGRLGTTGLAIITIVVATGEVIDRYINSQGTGPRALALRGDGLQGSLIVAFSQSSTIKYYKIQTNTANRTVYTTAVNASLWDVCELGDSATDFGIYWYKTSSTDIRGVTYNKSGSVVTAEAQIVNEVAKNVLSATFGTEVTLCWQSNSTSYPRLGVVDATDGVTLLYGAHDVSNVTANIVHMAGIEDITTSFNRHNIAIEYAAAGGVPNFIDTYSTSRTAGGITQMPPMYHASICAKPINFNKYSHFFISTTQAVHKAICMVSPVWNTTMGNRHWHCEGRMLDGRGPDILPQNYTPQASAGAENSFIFGAMRAARAVSDGVVIEHPISASFRLQGHPKQSEAVGGSTVRTGGYLSVFDGHAYIPAGILEPPEIDALTSGAGSILAGTYSYKLVAEFQNSAGDIYYGAPSQAVSITLGGTGDVDVTFYPPAPWPAYAQYRVNIYVYRTLDGGTVYYNTGSVYLYKSHDTTAVPYSIQDNVTDANLADNQQLYTTGGVLENATAPSSRAIAMAGGRLWGIPSDDPYSVYASKPKIDGIGFEFAAALVKQIPVRDKLIDIAAMDSNLVVFSPSEIFVMPSTAPSNTGTGSFGTLQKVAEKIGCAALNGAITTPDGVMFVGEKGIHLLSRSLEVSFIGEPVRDSSTYTLYRNSFYKRDTDEVWFHFEVSGTEGGTLIYNRTYRRWSIVEGHATSDVGDLVLESTGRYRVFADSTQIRQDTSGTNSVFKIVTPWLTFGSYQTIKRLWKATLLGEYRDDCDLIVKTYIDWDEGTAVDTQTFDTSSGYTRGDTLQVSFTLARQKAQAYKFEIYDANTSGIYHDSFRPSVLTLEYGIDGAGVKVPASISL